MIAWIAMKLAMFALPTEVDSGNRINTTAPSR